MLIFSLTTFLYMMIDNLNNEYIFDYWCLLSTANDNLMNYRDGNFKMKN